MASSNLLVRDLDGRTRCLVLSNPGRAAVPGSDALRAVSRATGLPAGAFRLVTGTREVTAQGQPLPCDAQGGLPTCTVLLRLCGGKGGFGSLLRGAGKGGKITNNDDACRDLSGRRMRVANAETKLTEWQARAKERELEKLAEAHVRKVTKEESKAAEAASAAAESLRQEREQTAAALAGAVDRGLVEAEKLRAAAKRKQAADEAAVPSKRNCMWTLPGETGALSSDDEAEDGAPKPVAKGGVAKAASTKPAKPAAAAAPAAPKTVMGPPPPPEAPAPAAAPPAARPPPPAAPAAPSVDLARFADAGSLEALGLEALKAELGARGLKVGGTLAERAARLFLLKSATLEQLDAKHKAAPPKR